MVYFGPSGASEEVIEAKMSKEKQAEYLNSLGLTTYEYPFTFGIKINNSSVQDLKKYFYDKGIKLSVHAPYYINFASGDDIQILKSNKYLLDSVLKAKEFGADRVIFHPGSLTGQERKLAQENIIKNLTEFMKILDENKIHDVYICPETMGKHGQLGTVEEVAEMCAIDERIIPCLDFGHINAFTLGGLDSVEKYNEIFDLFINKLNKKEIHIHFSRIEYTNKGEKKHLKLNDESEFGPDYKQMLESIKNFDAEIRVVSESAGSQTTDSVILHKFFKKMF